MSATFAIRDSATMFRRDLRRSIRFPIMTLAGILTPVVVMLVFVFVLGGQMGSTLGGGSYVNYVAPAFTIMMVCSASAFTAVNVAMDMQDGLIARFRTMAIHRPAIMIGVVAGSTVRTMISVVLVLGVAVLIGFRPAASPLAWLGVLGLLAAFTVAIQWISVSIGLRAKGVGGANVATMPIQFGAFISSAFVDPATMPAAIAWFAENQPLTPIINTTRGLLLGLPIGNEWAIALAWCAAFTAWGYLRARAFFNREPRRL